MAHIYWEVSMDSFYRTIGKINNLQRQFHRFFSRAAQNQKKSDFSNGFSFRKKLESQVKQKNPFEQYESVDEKKDTPILKGSSFQIRDFDSKKADILQLLKVSAKKYELPEELVMSVAKVESNFNEKAVSNKGAMGVMQIMPKTAEYLDLKKPFSAAENIEAGTRFLKYLMGVYKNDVVKAVAAYNAGEGAVNSKKFTGFRETNDYVKKVMHEYLNYNGLK